MSGLREALELKVQQRTREMLYGSLRVDAVATAELRDLLAAHPAEPAPVVRCPDCGGDLFNCHGCGSVLDLPLTEVPDQITDHLVCAECGYPMDESDHAPGCGDEEQP